MDQTKLPLVSQLNLTHALAGLGFEYTDEEKSGEISDRDRNLYEVSFLKRTFQNNCIDGSRHFLACLSLDTILESIQWTKKKDEEEFYVSNKDNICKMLKELALHPRSVFDEYAPRIIKASQEELDFTPIPNDYESCQREILSESLMW